MFFVYLSQCFMHLDPGSRALGGIICPGCISSNQSRFQGFSVEGGAGNEVEFKSRATILKILSIGLRHQYIFFKGFFRTKLFFLPPFSASCLNRHPDQTFNSELKKICQQAEQNLLILMIERQERLLSQTSRPSTPCRNS